MYFAIMTIDGFKYAGCHPAKSTLEAWLLKTYNEHIERQEQSSKQALGHLKADDYRDLGDLRMLVTLGLSIDIYQESDTKIDCDLVEYF